MPYIPHDPDETAVMLATVGLDSLDALFDEIPAALQCDVLEIPDGISERALRREMEHRAAQQPDLRCFAGGGVYAHHIPALVWEIAGRGEFYSAYTPYQPEASQGTLQTLYEFQSCITRLTGMDISNASLHDGPTALAEACLMALRLRQDRNRAILVPATLWPHWRAVLETILGLQDIQLVLLPMDPGTGRLILPEQGLDEREPAAMIIPQIGIFGVLEDVDTLSLWAEQQGLLRIAVCSPYALAMLKPPVEWGERGVDIAVGEAQPLGVPLSGGGPYLGFLACRRDHVRQLPGRLVAKTVDREGREGYCLTLQAREQHIRRGKATSNICTSQGLLVTAATIHMGALGADGLQQAAWESHRLAVRLQSLLLDIPGVQGTCPGPIFQEFAVRFPLPARYLQDRLLEAGILAGIPLQDWGMGEDGDMLVACTELLDDQDLEEYAAAIRQILQEGRLAWN